MTDKPETGKTTRLTFDVEWIDGGREPQCAPNPAYPNGVDVDASRGCKPSCVAVLPYPARRCGHYVVECMLCGMCVALTTAGRPDDPRSVRIACDLCKLRGKATA